MRINLQYGTDGLEVELPTAQTTVIEPNYVNGLADEAAAFLSAVDQPIDCAPLRDCISASDTVAVAIPDGTRPFPADRVLPWLLAACEHVAPDQFRIIIGTGSHRSTSPVHRSAYR